MPLSVALRDSLAMWTSCSDEVTSALISWSERTGWLKRERGDGAVK